MLNPVRKSTSARCTCVAGSAPRRPKPPRRWRHLGTVLCAALALAPAISRAQTDYWNGSNDYWDVASDWSLGALPGAGNAAENDTSGTITFSQNGITASIASFLNTGSGGFNLTDGSLTTTAFFQNTGSGTINLSAGTLNVGSDFINSSAGAVNLSGATVNVTGNFLNSGTGSVTVSGGTNTITGNLSSAGILTLNGGTLSGSGASTSTLEVDNSFIINGGTLSNFTVNPGVQGNTSYGVTFNANNSNLLSGVVMNAAMDLSSTTGAIAQVQNGLTLNGAATIGSSSHLSFSDPSGAESLMGTGSVTFTGTYQGNLDVESGTTLTVGSQMVIQTGLNGWGTIGSEYFNTSGSNALINNGTISANGTDSLLTIQPTSFTNNGTISASGGTYAEVSIQPTTFTNNGTLKADGGYLVIYSNWTNTGTLETSNGGTIYMTGTLNNAGQTFDPLNTVTGTHNALLTGTLTGGNLINSNALQIQNGTLADITLDGGLSLTNGFSAYIDDGVVFGSATPTLVSNSSILYFTGSNYTLPAMISTESGGTIDLGGTLNNTGTTFDPLNSIGGTHNAILTGTLTGGNLINSNALQILYGTLSNITPDGGLSLTNGYSASIGDGVTFGSATPTTIDNYSSLDFVGSNNPTFNTELIFGPNGGGNLRFDSLTLTLGSNALVHGANGNIGGDNTTLINQGTIDADSTGGTITIASTNFTNSGLLKAENGGTLYLYSSNTVLNGILSTDNSSAIIANGITIDNANSAFTVASGALTLSNATLQNATVNVSPGATGLAFAGYANTLSNVVVNSGLTINNGYYAYAYPNTLDTVTVNGNLLINGGSTNLVPNSLTVSGKTALDNSSSLILSNPTANDTSGLNEIVLGDSNGYGSLFQTDGNTLTITPNTLVHGASGYIGQIYGSASVGDTLINNGTISSDGGGYIAINDTTFTNNSMLEATNSSSLYVVGANFTNTGMLSATNNSNFYFYGTTFTNTGTLSATNGGTLNLNATATNLGGTMLADGTGSAIYLAGAINLSSSFVFNSTNGANIYLGGVLDNGGNPLTIGSGALTLEFGAIRNAIVNVNPGATGLAFADGGNTLSHVTVNSDLTVGNNGNFAYTYPNTLDTVTVNGNLLINGGNANLVPNSLTVSGKTTLDNGSSLIFSNAAANDTSGLNEIILGDSNGSGSLQQTDGNTLTITPNTLVHGAAGSIGLIYNNFSVGDSLINQGAISSDSGGYLYIFDTNFTNSGTLSATNGSTLILVADTTNLGGTMLADGAGSAIYLRNTINLSSGFVFNSTNGANIYLEGILDAGNQAFTIGSGALTLYYGTLQNATVNVSPGAAGLAFVSDSTLSHVTVNSDLTINNFGTYASTHPNTLNTVTVNGNLLINGGSYNLVPNTLTVSGRTTLDNGSSLIFSNAAANDTSGLNEIILGDSNGSGSLQQTDGNTLTITANTLVHGAGGSIGSIYQSASVGDTLINQGIINSDGDGGSFDIYDTTFINNNTLEATNGSSLDVVGTTFTNNGTLSATNGGTLALTSATTNLGGTMLADGSGSAIYLAGFINLNSGFVFNSTNGANIYLQGTLDAGNQAFTIGAGALTLDNGTLQNAIVNVSPGAAGLAFSGYANTLSNVVVNSDLTVGNSGSDAYANPDVLDTVRVNGDLLINGGSYSLVPNSLTVSGKTMINGNSALIFSNATANDTSGLNEIVLGDGNSYGSLYQTDGNVLTISANTLVHGTLGEIGAIYNYNSSSIGDTLINQGTISNDGGLLEIDDIAFINTGTLSATNGSHLYVYGTTFTNTGTLSATNDSTLLLAARTINLGGNMFADGAGSGIVLGGPSINLSSGFVFNSTNGGNIYLEGILDSGGNPLTIGSGSLTLEFGTLQNAIVKVSPGATGLAFADGANTLSHVTVNSDLTVGNSGSYASAPDTLDTVTVNGNLLINGGSTNLVPNTLTVSGKTTLDNGSSLIFSNAATNDTSGLNEIILGDSNGSGSLQQTDGNTLTITANTLVHGAGGSIGQIYNSSSVGDTLLNQGTISSDGGGTLSIYDTNFTNSGTLSAQNGSTLNLQSGANSSNGQITVEASSSLYAANTLTQTAGSTRVDGSLTVNNGFALQGGSLSGLGAIYGNVDNSGGVVAPGHSPGKLTIQGNYTQGANGSLDIELGGTQQGQTYDLLSVLNTATLAGQLDVKLVNGFAPTVGETFDFLTYGSRVGQFDQLLSFDNGYDYMVNYNDTTGTATLVVSVAAVPEASTLVTAGLLLGSGALLLRRRARTGNTTKRAA